MYSYEVVRRGGEITYGLNTRAAAGQCVRSDRQISECIDLAARGGQNARRDPDVARLVATLPILFNETLSPVESNTILASIISLKST
ncbi:MAG: hypothetical protein WDN30_02835 [Pararobbsia sp.]